MAITGLAKIQLQSLVPLCQSNAGCIGLAQGSLTEEWLQEDATIIARKFAQDPTTFAIQAQSLDASYVLFTVSPNDKRSVYTLRAATPYLHGLVMEEIAKFDTAD